MAPPIKTTSSPKSILVTGGSAGIGGQVVSELAQLGHKVFFCGRNMERGRQKQAELVGQGLDAQFVQADLSSQDGVAKLAEHIVRLTPVLDVLINNVGGVYENKILTSDGVEATMAMNLVHPYLLAALLFASLSASQSPDMARVIHMSTGYHHLVRVSMADLMGDRWDCGMNVYGRSKLISVQAGEAIGAAWIKHGVGLHFADPGMAQTPLTMSMTASMFPWYGRFLVPAIRQVQACTSLSWCASSSVWLASAPRLPSNNGVYVLPGPHVLPRPLVGYSSWRSALLVEYVASMIAPKYRESFRSTYS